MAINKNKELNKNHSFSDRAADFITNVAGSMPFLILNLAWFTIWVLINTGVLGENLIVDSFPFSFLTTAVSLEAIILSTFVLMSQRRQAKLSELRTELDYRTDLESDVDIKTIVSILERIAKRQNIDVADLLAHMKSGERKVEQGENQSE